MPLHHLQSRTAIQLVQQHRPLAQAFRGYSGALNARRHFAASASQQAKDISPGINALTPFKLNVHTLSRLPDLVRQPVQLTLAHAHVTAASNAARLFSGSAAHGARIKGLSKATPKSKAHGIARGEQPPRHVASKKATTSKPVDSVKVGGKKAKKAPPEEDGMGRGEQARTTGFRLADGTGGTAPNTKSPLDFDTLRAGGRNVSDKIADILASLANIGAWARITKIANKLRRQPDQVHKTPGVKVSPQPGKVNRTPDDHLTRGRRLPTNKLSQQAGKVVKVPGVKLHQQADKAVNTLGDSFTRGRRLLKRKGPGRREMSTSTTPAVASNKNVVDGSMSSPAAPKPEAKPESSHYAPTQPESARRATADATKRYFLAQLSNGPSIRDPKVPVDLLGLKLGGPSTIIC
ncbi:hypothetical protein V8E36_008846 [Tilletia maclaganii]